MLFQGTMRCKAFLTLRTCNLVFPAMYTQMSFQVALQCKAFLTDCTHVRPWLVITWMSSDIITISFNVYIKRLRFINVISFTLKCLGVPCIRTTQQAYVCLIGWSLTSLFSTNTAISETKGGELRGLAVEHRSSTGVLSLSCARPVADG